MSVESDIIKMAVMFYGMGYLPTLRTLPREQVQRLANEANQISAERELIHLREKQFVVPSWGPDKLTGGQVIALMVFSLWVLCGENEIQAAPLVEAWPIKEVMLLCPRPKS